MNNLIKKEEAFSLMQQYINGWKSNDIQLIESCLTEDCIVIESQGPRYHGINQIKNWFYCWLKCNGRVLYWDTLSFYFCEIEQTGFYEWNFSCCSNENKYVISGASIVKFSNQKISFIHEYRMTHSAYDWDQEKLVSE